MDQQLQHSSTQGLRSQPSGANSNYLRNAGSEHGSDSGKDYVQALSRGTNVPFIKLVAKDGSEKVMQP